MAYDREFPVGFFNHHIYDDLMIAIISNFLVESQGFTDLFLFMTYDREFAVGFLCSWITIMNSQFFFLHSKFTMI